MAELTRQQLLDILENDWATYVEHIQRFSPAAQTEFLFHQGYGCLADLLAHILAWWEEGQNVIKHLCSNPNFALPNYEVDAFNAQAVERFGHCSERAILESFEQARSGWIDFIENLPDSAFQNKKITHRLYLELISHMRFCLDMNQGGAMVDLRPYAAKLIRPCGVGTKANQDASYPFLVQSLYRAGFFTHYAGEGAVKSCKIGNGSEQVDLCTCRTLASFSEEGDTRIITLDPVTIEFADFSVRVQTVFRLTEGSGEVEILRRILDSSDPEAELSIDEYITACYGTTEYPEDMTGIRLTLTNTNKTKSIAYAYQCRESELENVHCAEAVIPQVDSLLSMRTDASKDASAIGYFREGFSFSPMYTLGIRKTIKAKGELRTWLKVAKAS